MQYALIRLPDDVTVDPMRRVALALMACSLAAFAGCRTRQPDDLLILDVPGAPRYVLATEDGVVALAGDDLAVDTLPVSYWYRGDRVIDVANVEHRSADFGLLTLRSLKTGFATFAASEPEPGETIWVQILEDDLEHRPRMVELSLYRDGDYGDLLAVEEFGVTAEELAVEWNGAGIYVRRKGAYELVGILNGVVAANPEPSRWSEWFGPHDLLAFAGIDAIAPTLPRSSDYFARRIRMFRPDFEHGLESDGSEGRRENR